jgi:hypothetical protein
VVAIQAHHFVPSMHGQQYCNHIHQKHKILPKQQQGLGTIPTSIQVLVQVKKQAIQQQIPSIPRPCNTINKRLVK